MPEPEGIELITIYGKKNCPKCESAKQKMDLLKLPYTFVDIQEPPAHWRQTQASMARAMYELLLDERPDLALPLLEVDAIVRVYPEAMALLRRNK